jgi:hypothetical protein
MGGLPEEDLCACAPRLGGNRWIGADDHFMQAGFTPLLLTT